MPKEKLTVNVTRGSVTVFDAIAPSVATPGSPVVLFKIASGPNKRGFFARLVPAAGSDFTIDSTHSNAHPKVHPPIYHYDLSGINPTRRKHRIRAGRKDKPTGGQARARHYSVRRNKNKVTGKMTFTLKRGVHRIIICPA